MPFPHRARRVAAYAAFGLITSFPLVAQTVATTAAADTGASPKHIAANPWPQRGWISVGVGAGTSPYGSLAAVATGWYSVGPVVAGVRHAGAGQWFGEQRSDQAFLMGARTRGSRAFLLGGVGTAKVESSWTCDGPCGSGITRPSTTEMAYAFEAHANASIVGLGVMMFGVLGPTSTRYNALALTIDAGWFGP